MSLHVMEADAAENARQPGRARSVMSCARLQLAARERWQRTSEHPERKQAYPSSVHATAARGLIAPCDARPCRPATRARSLSMNLTRQRKTGSSTLNSRTCRHSHPRHTCAPQQAKVRSESRPSALCCACGAHCCTVPGGNSAITCHTWRPQVASVVFQRRTTAAGPEKGF
jgi:hypothetical protein